MTGEARHSLILATIPPQAYCRTATQRKGGWFRRSVKRERLSFEQNVAGNFSAWPECFLGLAIQLRLDAAGISKRQHELILSFPLGFFTRPQQRFLRAAAIDLNHNPAQLGRFKIKHQRFIGIRRSLKRGRAERPLSADRRRNGDCSLWRNWHGTRDRTAS